MNVKDSHTLTTTTTGSKNSQKGVNSQVDYQNHNAQVQDTHSATEDSVKFT